MRFAIYARDGFDCVYCRMVFPIRYDGRGLTLDHVIPRWSGGAHTPDNLVTACVRCNCSAQGKRQYKLPFPADTAVRARVRRALRRAVSVEAGRWLARLARSVSPG
jgi:5-methylcytosine-specific restriction endonuclease McrA